MVVRGGWSAGGKAIVESYFIISFNFWLFMGVLCGVGGGIDIVISQ